MPERLVTAKDAIAPLAVSGALVSTPAWVPWLQHVNLILTAISVTVGIVAGVLTIRNQLRKGKY